MILKIGHRGAAGHGPENTLLSFKKALELDVDMVELDVQKCKTGELVGIHDNRVDRTTNGTGYVAEMSFEELRKLDAGKGEKIPTLHEVLDLVDKKTKVNIELKSENTAEEVEKNIEEYVNKGGDYDDFLVSSFIHPELLNINNEKIKLGVLITAIPVGLAEFAEKMNVYSLNPSIEFVNKDLVDDAHKRGLKVFVFVVNKKEDIERMKEWGVDGIFSDFPERIK